MSKRLKRVGIVFGVIFVLGAIAYVDLAVYPFRSHNPNYSDVERVFNRMQFPAEWKLVRDSQNKGIAGRACPIEPDSVCFHKSKLFTITASATIKDAEMILRQTGCNDVAIRDNRSVSDKKEVYTLECAAEGLTVASDFDRNRDEFYVSVSTR